MTYNFEFSKINKYLIILMLKFVPDLTLNTFGFATIPIIAFSLISLIPKFLCCGTFCNWCCTAGKKLSEFCETS